MSAPGLHHRKPHLVSSELPGKALTNGRRSARVVLGQDDHWHPQSPNYYTQVMSKRLRLQHPSPPRPCIVLALPTFSFLRLERPSSVHRRALSPHRASPCSILSPVHAHLPSHLFRPRTDDSFSSLVRSGLEGFYNCHRANTGPRPQTSDRSQEAVMSAPGLHHRKPHLVSSELPGKALTNGRRSACVVLCWPDGHWHPQSPNYSSHVKTTAPAAPQPTTTVHSTCTPYLQLPEARTPIFRPPTGISPASRLSLFYPQPRPRPSSVSSLPSTDGR